MLLSEKETTQNRKFTPIRELADELDLSFHFLTKIMQELTSAGVVESFRGPNGGVGLARSAKKIAVLDVITAVDGTDLFTGCALGLPHCNADAPCPLHEAWSRRKIDILRLFEKTTLDDLVKGLQRQRRRS